MALTLHGTVSDNTAVLDRPNAKPLIINGDMAVAQRGTSVTESIPGSGYQTVDRFRTTRSSDEPDELVLTQEQSTDAPDGFGNSYKIIVSTPETTLAADEMIRVEQRMEGQDLQLLKKGTSDAQAVTLSFYVKGSVTGTYIVNIHDNDNSRIIAASYTINSANTWEKKVLSFVGDTTGTLDNDNARSLSLYWYLGAGTDWTSGTLETSWATFTKANLAVGQTNILTTSSATWQMTGVQLEVGEFDANSIAPFQHESYGDNLARCQRYYQKIREADVAYFASGFMYSTTIGIGITDLAVKMRTAPTLVTNSNPNQFTFYRAGAGDTVSTFALNSATESRIAFENTTEMSGTAGDAGGWYASGANGIVDVNAEL